MQSYIIIYSDLTSYKNTDKSKLGMLNKAKGCVPAQDGSFISAAAALIVFLLDAFLNRSF